MASQIKNIMAKRATAMQPHKKSKHSHKTAKRLAIKKEMLIKKNSKGKSK
jgi:hypothetical protein